MNFITGISGFIGVNLAARLLANGEHVIGIDNFLTSPKSNLKYISKASFKQMSVGELNQQFFKKYGIKKIFHLAAVPSVSRSVDDPICSHQNNTTETLHLLNVLKKIRYKGSLVFASSSSVYGQDFYGIKQEIFRTYPASPYAMQKDLCEKYIKFYVENYNLNSTILRFFNVFGKHQNPKSQYAAVIPIFITNCLKNTQSTIYGNGLQTRDFTYIDNVIDAMILSSENKSPNTFNVACGKQTSLIGVYSYIAQKTNYKKQPIFLNKRIGDIDKSCADIGVIKQMLDFMPRVDIWEGLDKTINFYKGIL